MANILVTGASGFIGSHLLEYLLKEKNKVYVLERREPKALSKKIIFIKGDITKQIRKIPKHIDIIYHLAAISSPVNCLNNPKIATIVNVIGTQNMLDIARKRNSKFIFTSTCYVYGDVEKYPTRENTYLKPNSPLGATKAAAEHIIKTYYDCYDVHSVVLRIFTVYGPKSAEYQFVTSLIKQLLNKKEVVLRDPTPTRDYVYILDVISALSLARNINQGFDILNIGTGEETSVREIAKLIIKISNERKMKLRFRKQKKRLDEQKGTSRMCADIEKAKKILKWKPQVKIEEGLKKTYEYYKKLRGGSV